MNVLCLCLSPAVDATVRLDAWPTDGCVIKNAAETLAPGGKAVNVARWLAKRGVAVSCGGLLGEDNAVLFERELARYGIGDRFVRVPGSTRVNEMFVTPRGAFKVNRPAFPGIGSAFTAAGHGGLGVLDVLVRLVGESRADMCVLSGSLPRDFPPDAYRVLVEAAKGAGARTVLDASGAALVEGIKARPDVVKPNADECADLVGFVPRAPEDFRRATAVLKSLCEMPIISDGAAGCWFDGAFVAAPRVETLDTTAAGDTLLAEWCFGGDARSAVAAGSAACTMPGGEPPAIEFVEELRRLME